MAGLFAGVPVATCARLVFLRSADMLVRLLPFGRFYMGTGGQDHRRTDENGRAPVTSRWRRRKTVGLALALRVLPSGLSLRQLAAIFAMRIDSRCHAASDYRLPSATAVNPPPTWRKPSPAMNQRLADVADRTQSTAYHSLPFT